ncbi:hypothetical protein K470DRAFT_274405 [Piedraia hortae CBS 480.64]|uniref:Uncharacterized protein n=1 Tax=Piedraia hortae CBS 480.64 TaxID=1314780 RepID=A0A6A7C7H0_9PEZI|nr:hypothetical protein K470DRAFT_274405 [Piedraia hortae CBS 480.64]
MSSLTSWPSLSIFSRNKDGPPSPVLKDEDETFFKQQIDKAHDGQSTRQKESNGKSSSEAKEGSEPRKEKEFELPSQEEAEAAVHQWNIEDKKGSNNDNDKKSQKRTWTSYLPSMKSPGKGKAPEKQPSKEDNSQSSPTSESKEEQKQPKQTWTQYASDTYSSLPSMPNLSPNWMRRDTAKDAEIEPVRNEDGTINEEKTREKQEKELSVLLSRLNVSSINNHLFAISQETEKIYSQFTQVLKDVINGVPTAYQDMDKLMREAGPTLEKQFASLPPFVQALVKTLPAKLGTSFGPGLLSAMGEKSASDETSGPSSTKTKQASTPRSSPNANSQGKSKQKRQVPGLKGLIKQQGAVAGILQSIVNFLQTRFPFLASATNVAMSLALFLMIFVFYWCHKRGREARLAEESASESGVSGDDDNADADIPAKLPRDEKGKYDKTPSAQHDKKDGVDAQGSTDKAGDVQFEAVKEETIKSEKSADEKGQGETAPLTQVSYKRDGDEAQGSSEDANKVGNAQSEAEKPEPDDNEKNKAKAEEDRNEMSKPQSEAKEAGKVPLPE